MGSLPTTASIRFSISVHVTHYISRLTLMLADINTGINKITAVNSNKANANEIKES